MARASDLIQKDFDAMPPALRTLLSAELAAGNEIVEVGHSFPAPPAGAYFRLAKPVLSRAQKSGDGIYYYDRNGATYSGEITDAKRFFFLLEPPHPPKEEPDMDAIRAAMATPSNTTGPITLNPVGASPGAKQQDDVSQTPMQRFRSSMVMNFDKWHDGIGYDLAALHEMSPVERKLIHDLLIRRGAQDWRDVEALACFDTPESKAALVAGLKSNNSEVRNAVTGHAPGLISDEARTASLVKELETAVFFGGLTSALDQVTNFHPPKIVDALFRGALKREGDVAVHFAAMLSYIHGKAPEPFDWEQRPFFLRFNTDVGRERETVFQELCEKIGVDPTGYLER